MHEQPVPSTATDPDDDLISEVRQLRRRPGELRMLVLGTDAWLTWSVAHCLVRERYRPVVLGPRTLASLCRLTGCIHLPLPAGHSKDVRDELDAICATHEIDVVLPVDLPAMQLAARASASLRTARTAAVPDRDALACCADLWQFVRVLAACGIPHAPAELARNADALRDTRLTFPVTTRSLGYGDATVRRYDSLTDLTLALLDGAEARFPRLVEELLPGSPVGFAFLARHGRLMAHTAFEPRAPNRWRYFEAAELRAHAARLVDAIGYHGVGVLEARYDRERHVYRVVALRPGFWDSHLCAERAGMNFPDLLARMPEVGAGAGFMARPRPVSLSYLERGAAGVIRLTALAETLRRRIAGSLAP